MSISSGKILRVVVTGGECTGKTTLAAELAAHYGTVWVPEAARTIAEMKGTPLDVTDVEKIARAHVAAADVALLRARGLLVLDQDLLSTVAYARHYYGSCPTWIENAAQERQADLYLLCHPDVPWIPDPARDRPDRREEIHGLFAEVLASARARVVNVQGDLGERRRKAVAAVDGLLSGA